MSSKYFLLPLSLCLCLGNRIRTCDLPRPRRVNNHRYLPRNINFSFVRVSDSILIFLFLYSGSGRIRTYTSIKNLIYSQASQPIAQHFLYYLNFETRMRFELIQNGFAVRCFYLSAILSFAEDKGIEPSSRFS